ncbi:hypothetical protein EFD56_00745 [Rhizobium phaseoli]|nr:hypothetical protein EFD56_00745 [Rhizobium phaseoli]
MRMRNSRMHYQTFRYVASTITSKSSSAMHCRSLFTKHFIRSWPKTRRLRLNPWRTAFNRNIARETAGKYGFDLFRQVVCASDPFRRRIYRPAGVVQCWPGR